MVVALLFSFMLMSTRPTAAYYQGFTHAVYTESVVGTWCPYCVAEIPMIDESSRTYAGSLHRVEFHVALPGRDDPYSTEYGLNKITEYHITGTPTHAHDAGFLVQSGAANFTTNVENSGRRPVHRVTLAVMKRVQVGVLSFEGSIKEEDGKPFNGKIVVIAVENGLPSTHGIQALTWNGVFREYLLTRDVTLASSQHSIFSGTWTIPKEVNVANVELIVVAFDSADLGQAGGALAVQSVSDKDSGVVVPEFNIIGGVAAVAMAASLVFLRDRRSRLSATRSVHTTN